MAEPAERSAQRRLRQGTADLRACRGDRRPGALLDLESIEDPRELLSRATELTLAFRAATDRATKSQAIAAAQLADPRRFDRLTAADVAEQGGVDQGEDYARRMIEFGRDLIRTNSHAVGGLSRTSGPKKPPWHMPRGHDTPHPPLLSGIPGTLGDRVVTPGRPGSMTTWLRDDPARHLPVPPAGRRGTRTASGTPRRTGAPRAGGDTRGRVRIHGASPRATGRPREQLRRLPAPPSGSPGSAMADMDKDGVVVVANDSFGTLLGARAHGAPGAGGGRPRRPRLRRTHLARLPGGARRPPGCRFRCTRRLSTRRALAVGRGHRRPRARQPARPAVDGGHQRPARATTRGCVTSRCTTR
ncbi:hypothetical protein STANM309S_03376 [Streptomyces tanashiensis]